MSREAMQQALGALEKVIEAFGPGLTLQQKAITALRQALETKYEQARSLTDELMDCVDRLGSEADTVDPRVWDHLLVYAPKPEEEPVAWRTFDGEGGYDYRSYEMNETYDKEWSERNPNHKGWVEPLYTAPQKKEWVGLTDREVELIDEMIETQLLHAERCDHMANSTMAQKQKAWDLERVELLRKLKEKNT